MTWGILGFATLCITTIVGFALDSRSSRKAKDAYRDLLDGERKVSAEYKSGRDVEVAAHAVTSAQLAEAKQRLDGAEAQLRDFESRRIAKLKESDAQTVADVLVDTLGKPWPGVTGPRKPEDELEKP